MGVVLISLYTPNSIAEQQGKQVAGNINLMPLQAQKLINQRPALVIIDVLTARERKRRSIERFLHILLTDVFRGKVEFSAEQPVLLHCAVGGRRVIAAKLL
ncbi:MAG: rhodanese-like domain-containing protein [Desulfocapsaceae bacterium]|nr:rhodanese-like domain-containing protein [Desulfocapsaceae bacterium]